MNWLQWSLHTLKIIIIIITTIIIITIIIIIITIIIIIICTVWLGPCWLAGVVSWTLQVC